MLVDRSNLNEWRGAFFCRTADSSCIQVATCEVNIGRARGEHFLNGVFGVDRGRLVGSWRRCLGGVDDTISYSGALRSPVRHS